VEAVLFGFFLLCLVSPVDAAYNGQLTDGTSEKVQEKNPAGIELA